MWFSERYTLSRGRSAVPSTFLRMRSCTWPRFSFLEILVSIASSPYSTLERSFASLSMIAAGSDARQTRSLRSCLSNLLLQPFAEIAHALVLVRIGRTQGAHFSGDLTDFLPVDSGQRNFGLLGIDHRFDPTGQRIFDRMRVAQVEHHHALALHFGAVADAHDFQLARPTLGHAFDRVVDQGARQAVQRRLRIILANGNDVSIFLLGLDARRQCRVQL